MKSGGPNHLPCRHLSHPLAICTLMSYHVLIVRHEFVPRRLASPSPACQRPFPLSRWARRRLMLCQLLLVLAQIIEILPSHSASTAVHRPVLCIDQCAEVRLVQLLYRGPDLRSMILNRSCVASSPGFLFLPPTSCLDKVDFPILCTPRPAFACFQLSSVPAKLHPSCGYLTSKELLVSPITYSSIIIHGFLRQHHTTHCVPVSAVDVVYVSCVSMVVQSYFPQNLDKSPAA